MNGKKSLCRFVLWLLAGVLLVGCLKLVEPQQVSVQGRPLSVLGYVIQVGAFSNLDNAVGLMDRLRGQGLDAYYFKADDGLFKVRFGNFAFLASAQRNVAALRRENIVDDYYIVKPMEYSGAAAHYSSDNSDLRKSITKTARRFLGVPYKWGGESARDGFDCSGLTMTVYRLNGLELPRNSRQQYQAGRAVKKSDLGPGDLVFFATKGGNRVTHVGIYVGGGRFIHAPRTGKTIRVASLDDNYFAQHYQGGRTYLGAKVEGGYF